MHVTLPRILAGALLVALAGMAAAQAAAPSGFDPVGETERLLSVLPAEQRARSDAYFEGGYWLQLWNLVISLVVAWGLLRMHLTLRLRDLVERRFKFRYVQGLVFIAIYAVLVAVITLPWDAHEAFIREHQYGLSNQTLLAWLVEHLIGLAVGVIASSLIGALLYLGIRRWPQRWWVAASIATPFLLLAHELGHYVLNHLVRHVVYLSLLFTAGFAFTHGFFGFAARRMGATWGLRGIGDLAGLPLVSAALALFMFVATPVQNNIIRTAEVEADIFGLNAGRQPDGFATTALKLAEYRKLAPGPWEEALLFDHPSGRSRILMAMRWKAEHLAELPPAGQTGAAP